MTEIGGMVVTVTLSEAKDNHVMSNLWPGSLDKASAYLEHNVRLEH